MSDGLERRQVEELLAQVEPYSSLGSEDVAHLALTCRTVRLAPHEVLLHDEELISSAYVLAEGRLVRYLLTAEGRRLLLNDTSSRAAFATAAALGGMGHIGTIEAVEPSVVVGVPTQELEALAAKCPSFSQSLAHVLARSSIRQTRALYELMFPVPVRLARRLVRDAGGAKGLDLAVSKAVLAEALGTVPETLSRALGTLRSRGLIEVEGSRVIIVDERDLRSYACL